MRVLLFFIVFFTACNASQQDAKSWSGRVQVDPNFTDSFFFKHEWSYDPFVTKDDDGRFENTMGNGKTTARDTQHLVHSASIFHAFSPQDTTFAAYSKIKFGNAYLVGQAILLKFDQLTPSSHDILDIKIKNGAFFTNYLGGAPAVGDLYYDFEKQKLILQKEHYTVGDTIKGYLDFQTDKPHFAHLKGAFKLPLKNNSR